MHRLDQKVWGDFKVQFKSPQTAFYFWLNVSAILYNGELRNISQITGESIHFDEFEEILESDFGRNKPNMYSLLLPEYQSGLMHQEDQDLDNRVLSSEPSSHNLIL